MKLKSATTVVTLLVCAALVCAPRSARAQRWNDTRARALVERATALRALQLADTALRDYRAEAHGYVTFLAQLGEGFTEPPKIVKADELALDVYWMAPDHSKQLIRGRRDTLLLPTDINYHRDHLGIIQNNFPEIIRLGDGDEVRDVPHPLSPAGLGEYDFAISDSLEIRLGPRTLYVYEVRVRPKDDRLPRAIGALYIDRETAELARMALSFTRAALKDRDLEDVAVVLENGLIEGRFWLPRRQEIEIRRSGTWLDYPARGIIRGRWEICCYAVNTGLNPAMFTGPEIVVAFTPVAEGDSAPPSRFTGEILDNLPDDVRAVTDAEILEVQEEARALVRAQALAQTRSTALAGRSISDFVRFNRVEGLALGAGLSQRLGGGVSLFVGGRYGFADRDWKGRGALSYRRASGAGVSLAAYDDHELVGEVAERSLFVNSVAAQEFGSDHTDAFGARGIGVTLFAPRLGAWTASASFAVEKQRGLAVNARSAMGSFQPALPAARLEEQRLEVVLEQPTRLTWGGFEARYRLAASAFRFALPVNEDVWGGGFKGAFRANVERPFGTNRLVTHFLFAAVSQGKSQLPLTSEVAGELYVAPPKLQPQQLVYLGGSVTGPGYDFHEFVGTSGLSARLEWQMQAPFPSISLGRFGRAPARMTVAPYVSFLVINSGAANLRRGHGLYPSVGLATLTIFDMLRVDVARGLRGGRWTLSIDLNRDFWSVL